MSEDPWKKPSDYLATVVSEGHSGMVRADITPGPWSAVCSMVDPDSDYWIAHRMRVAGLRHGSLLVAREDPLLWRRYENWCQILEAEEAFLVPPEHVPEVADWLQNHPGCQAELIAMDVAVMIRNADAIEQTYYVLCRNTDAYAVVADAWKDAPMKVAFPLLHGRGPLSRKPIGGSFRNPLVLAKGYKPASMTDLELARIAYNTDYPGYLPGKTTPAVQFDTEVSVDEFAVVDYVPNGSGDRWLQAWVWLPGPNEDDDD
jgi:hypothetical protein